MKGHRFFFVFLAFFLLLSVCAFTDAQTQVVKQEWVRRFNGPANRNDEANALAIDNQGNIYVTGRSVLDPTTGNDYLTIRYNPDSTEVWVTGVNFGMKGNDIARVIVVDNLGNVYVTGQGDGLYATVKYNSTTGDTIWTRQYSSGVNTLNDATDIALDDDGNIYVTGQFDISANPATTNIGTIK